MTIDKILSVFSQFCFGTVGTSVADLRHFCSVADPGCLSWILDPDFFHFTHPDPGSRIPDPKTVTKERGEKNFCQTFFCSHKFHKIVNYFIFEMLKKKNFGQFSKNYRTFYPKIVTKLSKIWVWDPGSGKNPFRIPDPGSRGQKGTGCNAAFLFGYGSRYEDPYL
jgi:hypothetical protein